MSSPASPDDVHVPDAERARGHRAFGLVLVGMSVAVWWPAFTLGAWQDFFFDQLLTVWVAATAAMVVVAVQPRSAGRRWPRILALSVPSFWLLLMFLEEPSESDVLSILVLLVGALVGLAGIPFTLWTLCRVLWPELFTEFRSRARVTVAVVVTGVAIASFLLGVFQNRFLTCEDFDISGNSRPPGCVSMPEE